MSDADAAIVQHMGTVPHLHALGIRYVGHGDDWAELEMPFAPQLVAYPDFGTVASAAIFSLMDSAAGFAVVVRHGSRVAVATLDMRLDYLHAAASGATVTGRATCYRLTRQVAFVRGVAHDGDPARPLVNMAGTFMLGSGA